MLISISISSFKSTYPTITSTEQFRFFFIILIHHYQIDFKKSSSYHQDHYQCDLCTTKSFISHPVPASARAQPSAWIPPSATPWPRTRALPSLSPCCPRSICWLPFPAVQLSSGRCPRTALEFRFRFQSKCNCCNCYNSLSFFLLAAIKKFRKKSLH